jgi:hypothetical protein
LILRRFIVNVTYSDQTRQRAEDHLLLEQATKSLEKVVGPSAELVSVQWDRGQDERGDTIYRLTISNCTEEVSAAFTPDELRHPSHVRSRLLDLWGDFLQVLSNTQVKKLQQLVMEGE